MQKEDSMSILICSIFFWLNGSNNEEINIFVQIPISPISIASAIDISTANDTISVIAHNGIYCYYLKI